MGEIVSLNKFRKTRARAAEKQQAAANRTRHGRDKAEKRRDDDDRARHETDVDSTRLEAGEDTEQSD